MVDPLLALCARSVSHREHRQRLVKQAQIYTDWPSLPRRAESMALAPLTYTHLQEESINLPADSRSALMALTLRHRRANQIRYFVLAEVLAVFRETDIDVLVLKGGALAKTVYPRPGLRPMRDMDILVREADALRAQMLLVKLGFKEHITQSKADFSLHHLPIVQRVVDGLTVSVEVHQRLLPDTARALGYEELNENVVSFSVNEEIAQTLSHENMIYHIYLHSFAYPLIEQSIRLIWVADFVSLVEKYVDEIDWEQVQSRFPQVWNVIPVFHYLTPWSDKVLNGLNLDVDPQPKGIGQTFQGWPQSSLTVQRRKGIRRFLGDTFWPSEWWTWLYYGADRRSLSWLGIRLFRHPLHIANWVLEYLLQRN